MISKIIKIDLKRYLPFYIVSFVILGWPFLLTILNSSFYKTQNGYYNSSSLFYLPLIFLAILLLVAPFIAQSYRFHLSSVDTFYQAPIKKNHLKYINSLCLIIPTLISFTFLFFLGVLLIYLKATFEPLPEDVIGPGYQILYFRADFNYGYYFLGYLFVLLVFPSIFFFSSFVVSKTNRVLNAILLEIAVFVGLWLLLMSHMTLIRMFMTLGQDDAYISIFTGNYFSAGICPVYPAVMLGSIFESLITKGTMIEFLNLAESEGVDELIQLIFFLVFYAYTIFDYFYFKEPSGEYAGKPEGHDFMQMFLLHASFGVASIIGGLISTNIILGLMYFIFLFTTYYLVLSLVKKNFKIRLIDLWFLLGNISLYGLCMIFSNVYNAVGAAVYNI